MGRNFGYGRNQGNYHNRGGNQHNQRNHGNKNTKPKGQKPPPPYSFIEPNKSVFYPQDFGEIKDCKISFEKPFSDSQSGILELKIIAKSDIFTGGFMGKDADNKDIKPFFKIGGNYALSGSSVRGVIRTISQVLSFAKFQTEAPEFSKKVEFVNRKDERKRNFCENELKLDMTERIFGTVSQSKSTQGISALKSRISFSHFLAQKVCKTNKEHISYIMLNPIETAKKENKKLPKFLKNNGFRFYASLGQIEQSNTNKAKDEIISTISPLGKGTEFIGKLRYFNLTKAELGLVLLCLTALDSNKGEYYKFGGGKFYGYGDAQIELKGISEALKNECTNAYKNLLAKNGFDIDSRIQDLRNASQKQSIDSTSTNFTRQNSQNRTTHHNSPKKQYDKFDKYRSNTYADDDDDDSHNYL